MLLPCDTVHKQDAIFGNLSVVTQDYFYKFHCFIDMSKLLLKRVFVVEQ
jgi:hypothetical protein